MRPRNFALATGFSVALWLTIAPLAAAVFGAFEVHWWSVLFGAFVGWPFVLILTVYIVGLMIDD